MHERFALVSQLLIGWLLVIGLLLPAQLRGQVRTVTAKGDTIVVYPDGSWKPYGLAGEPRPAGTRPQLLAEKRRADSLAQEGPQPSPADMRPEAYGGEERLPETEPPDDRFPVNPYAYERPESAFYHLDGPQQRYRLWYQPQLWMPVDPSELNTQAQVVLTFLPAKGEATAMLTVVPQAVDLKALVAAIQSDAESITQNTRLVAQEMRLVNDRYLLCVRMDGSIQDQRFTYYSYYRPGPDYTLQFTVYAPHEVFLRYQQPIQALLNGLVVP